MSVVATNTRIVVNLKVEWLHKWEQCPIEEVSFLRDLHRHIFWIRVEKEVSHDDRDIEIIMFKRKIEFFLSMKFFTVENWCHLFWNMSCEMIARLLCNEFNLNSCEVLEDWENGAKVDFIYS